MQDTVPRHEKPERPLAAALRAASTSGASSFAEAAAAVMAVAAADLGAKRAWLVETSGERGRVLAEVASGDAASTPGDGWLPMLIDGGTVDDARRLARPFSLGDRTIGLLAFAWDADRGHEPTAAAVAEACAAWLGAEWARRVETRREAERAEQRHRALVKGIRDGLFDWDLHTNDVSYSDRCAELLGHPGDDPPSRPDDWFNRVDSRDLAQLEADLAMCLAGQTATLRNQHRTEAIDGSTRWVLCRAEVVHDEDGEPARLVGSLSDTTEFKLAEEELRHAAEHDKLTGLPNRATLHARLEKAIRRHKLSGGRRRFALLFLDFDRFKVINDSLGHDAGDRLLVQIADRLRRHTRANDTAARLGGDEFVLLIEGVDRLDTALRIADRLLDTFAEPFDLDGHEVTSTASIGVVDGGNGYDSADAAIRDADAAMYHAKSRGKARFAVFDDDMHQQSRLRLDLERDLRRALETDQLHLAFQPVVEVEDGRATGFEALIRWRHPVHGDIRPDRFIHIAEESGLIVPLGRFVLEVACDFLGRLDAELPGSGLTVNVNLSRRQLVQPDLIEMVRRVVADANLDPRRIKFEITESVIMDPRVSVTDVLHRLRELGHPLAMDDFGTGHSSLSCLHEFPIDVLKIDRSFVQSLDRHIEFAAVIQAIVTLAHTLRMSVVAEGIETTEQLAVLQALDCDRLQGFLFARPLPADEAVAFVRHPAPLRRSA
ncbi:MAG: GGDEF and EAL domain-containing protein [Planctomycetota bacterium]